MVQLELLETNYLGYSEPMRYRCLMCGHEYKVNLQKVICEKRGCKQCSMKKKHKSKLDITMIRDYFDQQGCKLLEDYVNAFTKMKYICKCGNTSSILWSNFKKGKRCQKCKGRPRNPNRADVELNAKIIKKACKALRTVLRATNTTKRAKTFDLLGYNTFDLKKHIEKHPNWKSVKDSQWHLDHIFPVKAFIEHGLTDIALINSLDNLQPLTAEANMSKGGQYDKKSFVSWLKQKGVYA